MVIDDFKQLIVSGMASQGVRLSRIEKGQFELLKEYSRLLSGESQGADLPGVKDAVKATVCSLKALEALKTGKVQEFSYPV
jgi:hypothetical protein